jgi:hypothetical protein
MSSNLQKNIFFFVLLSLILDNTLFSQINMHIPSTSTGDKRPSLARTNDNINGDFSMFTFYAGLKNVTPANSIFNINDKIEDLHSNNDFKGQLDLTFGKVQKEYEYSIKIGVQTYYDFIVYKKPTELARLTNLIGAGYYNFDLSGQFVYPINILDDDGILKPGVNLGYQLRESSNFQVIDLDKSYFEVFSNSWKDRVSMSGNGAYANIFCTADLRKYEKSAKPVIALSIENIFSSLKNENTEIKYLSDLTLKNLDSNYSRYLKNRIENYVRVNFGIQLTFSKLFDFRFDIRHFNKFPEYRFELEKKIANIDLSIFTIFNEKTILNETRNSFNFMIGLCGENKDSFLRLFISYDNKNCFGMGLGFN